MPIVVLGVLGTEVLLLGWPVGRDLEERAMPICCIWWGWRGCTGRSGSAVTEEDRWDVAPGSFRLDWPLFQSTLQKEIAAMGAYPHRGEQDRYKYRPRDG